MCNKVKIRLKPKEEEIKKLEEENKALKNTIEELKKRLEKEEKANSNLIKDISVLAIKVEKLEDSEKDYEVLRCKAIKYKFALEQLKEVMMEWGNK